MDSSGPDRLAWRVSPVTVRLAALALAFLLWPGGIAITGAASASLAADRPSYIVLVTIDALRADHASALGYSRPTTPQLARWANRAAVFTRVRANGGWTFPGIGTLLTGLRPPAHRIDGPNIDLPALLDTLPEVLERHGYLAPGFLQTYVDEGFGFDEVEERFRMPYVGQADRKSELALGWLDEHRDQPSFLWLHYVVTHLPYQPSSEALARFPGDLDERAGRAFDGSRRMAIGLASGELVASEAGARALTDRYDACVWDADRAVGALLDGLESRGMFERAIVVVTADHGEELLERGEAGHAWWTYRGGLHEESVRVPLLVWAPGVEARRIDAPVEQVDVFPTLLDLAGIVVDPGQGGLEGRSLLPILEGGSLPARPAYAESTPGGFYAEPEIMGDARVRSVVEGDWKLIVSQGALSTRTELYRLDRDPGERVDLAAANPRRVRRLRELLAQWLLEERRRSFALRRDQLRPGAEEPLAAALESRAWVLP